jgi:hypothetical protein
VIGVLAAVLFLSGDEPLARAHAHNDYAQERPLFGALELRFCSVEADVYLVDGKLLVGHDKKDLKSERTLANMYLRPLDFAVRAHKGSVYAQPVEFILLVDIKEDGAKVYEELKRELRPYDSWLTHYSDGKVDKRGVTVILSGDRPTSVLAAETSRVAFIDGRPGDVQPATLIPLISASWDSLFKWKGVGPVPPAEHVRLAALVSSCHANGQKLRFWGTVDAIPMWQNLYDAGVDLIGADRQKDLAAFLRRG